MAFSLWTTSTPAFGSTGPAFGSSSTPAFGATGTSVFGSWNPSLFDAQTPSGVSNAPAFGQAASTFGSSPFAATFIPFGAQATTPNFGSSGQSAFGAQHGGSRGVPYTATTETDVGAEAWAGKLESIPAMPAYKDKSPEELRWEDYQLGDKGGPAAPGQSPVGIGFGVSAAQSNPFGQSSASAFSTPACSNPFAPETSTFLSFSTPSFSFLFATSSSSNPLQSTVGTTSPFAFGSTPFLFNYSTPQGGLSFANTQASLFKSTTPAFGHTGSAFCSPFAQSTTPSFTPSLFNIPSTGFGGSLFSSTPSLNTPTSAFGQTTPSQSMPFKLFQPSQPPASGVGQTQMAGSSGFSGASKMFGHSNFGQPCSLFDRAETHGSAAVQPMPVTGSSGMIFSIPQASIGQSGTTPSVQYGISSLPVVDKPAPSRISSLFTTSNLSQRGFRLPSQTYDPKNDGQKIPFFSNEEDAPSNPKADAPFTPRENPRALFIRPVDEWPSTSFFTISNLSQRGFRLPSQTYDPKNDGQKIPFFSNEEDGPRNPKADALFIPRENPRAFFIRPVDEWPSTANAKQVSPMDDGSTPVNENETVSKLNNASVNGAVDGQKDAEDGTQKEQAEHIKPDQKSNGIHGDHSTEKQEPNITLNGQRAGKAAIVYEHAADIEAMNPKLHRSDYYTEPKIQELAAKEQAEPGFYRQVKDFVVGRHGYGSIKFFGETDVRGLDLESIVQFNNNEVIIYLDDSKKPPVGQGLNKPAEVTLLNVKCFDKKTKQEYTEGPEVEKYREMLINKTKEQDAEFVSYDPVKGELKFRVKHFGK